MLHIISKPLADPTLLERTEVGDTIILIEDATLEAIESAPHQQHWQRLLLGQNICVLAEDLAIRGLGSARILQGIKIVDYQGFVQLAVDIEVIHSWN